MFTSYLGRRSRSVLHIFSHDLPSLTVEFIILEVLLTSSISAISSGSSIPDFQAPMNAPTPTLTRESKRCSQCNFVTEPNLNLCTIFVLNLFHVERNTYDLFATRFIRLNYKSRLVVAVDELNDNMTPMNLVEFTPNFYFILI